RMLLRAARIVFLQRRDLLLGQRHRGATGSTAADGVGFRRARVATLAGTEAVRGFVAAASDRGSLRRDREREVLPAIGGGKRGLRALDHRLLRDQAKDGSFGVVRILRFRLVDPDSFLHAGPVGVPNSGITD